MCREANDVAQTKNLIHDLAKVRRKRRPELRKDELDIVYRLGPLIQVTEETVSEDTGKAQQEVQMTLEVLAGLRAEIAGGEPAPIMKLAFAGKRLDAAVERAVGRASRLRMADFEERAQQNLVGGSGALHRFSNRDNGKGCVLDEVVLEPGTLYAS